MLLGLFGITQSLTFQDIKAITLPLIMSGVILALAAIELTRQLRSQYKAQTTAKELPQQAKAEARVGWRRFGRCRAGNRLAAGAFLAGGFFGGFRQGAVLVSTNSADNGQPTERIIRSCKNAHRMPKVGVNAALLT